MELGSSDSDEERDGDPRGNPASRAPGRLPLGCQRRRCVQKSSGHSAGRRPEVRSLGVVNDASAAPNSRTRTDASTLPAAAPSRLVLEFRAPTRRPDTVMTHVASASFVLGPASRFDARILDETGARGRRRGHGLGPAIAAAAERRRAAELQAARHLHERHVALYAWGRCDAGQLAFWRGRLWCADVPRFLGSCGGVSDAEVGVIVGRKRRDTRRRRCEALRRRDERGGGVRFRRLLSEGKR